MHVNLLMHVSFRLTGVGAVGRQALWKPCPLCVEVWQASPFERGGLKTEWILWWSMAGDWGWMTASLVRPWGMTDPVPRPFGLMQRMKSLREDHGGDRRRHQNPEQMCALCCCWPCLPCTLGRLPSQLGFASAVHAFARTPPLGRREECPFLQTVWLVEGSEKGMRREKDLVLGLCGECGWRWRGCADHDPRTGLLPVSHWFRAFLLGSQAQVVLVIREACHWRRNGSQQPWAHRGTDLRGTFQAHEGVFKKPFCVARREGRPWSEVSDLHESNSTQKATTKPRGSCAGRGGKRYMVEVEGPETCRPLTSQEREILMRFPPGHLKKMHRKEAESEVEKNSQEVVACAAIGD